MPPCSLACLQRKRKAELEKAARQSDNVAKKKAEREAAFVAPEERAGR